MIFELPDFINKDVIFIGKGKEWASFEQFFNKYIRGRSLKNIYIDEENRDHMTSSFVALI